MMTISNDSDKAVVAIIVGIFRHPVFWAIHVRLSRDLVWSASEPARTRLTLGSRQPCNSDSSLKSRIDADQGIRIAELRHRVAGDVVGAGIFTYRDAFLKFVERMHEVIAGEFSGTPGIITIDQQTPSCDHGPVEERWVSAIHIPFTFANRGYLAVELVTSS